MLYFLSTTWPPKVFRPTVIITTSLIALSKCCGFIIIILIYNLVYNFTIILTREDGEVWQSLNVCVHVLAPVYVWREILFDFAVMS